MRNGTKKPKVKAGGRNVLTPEERHAAVWAGDDDRVFLLRAKSERWRQLSRDAGVTPPARRWWALGAESFTVQADMIAGRMAREKRLATDRKRRDVAKNGPILT